MKAQQKLAPGTWQHTMLRDNLRMLHLATRRMNKGMGPAVRIAPGNLPEALRAFTAMIRRTQNAQAKFAPGTSQHSLLRNRLKALWLANACLKAQARKWTINPAKATVWGIFAFSGPEFPPFRA